MDVRYSQEPEVGMVLKNGLKESKEVKDSQGSLSKTLLKEPQDSFSSSGAMENCEKSRTSTGDPDYCRRILVRGKSATIRYSELITLHGLFHQKQDAFGTQSRFSTRSYTFSVPDIICIKTFWLINESFFYVELLDGV